MKSFEEFVSDDKIIDVLCKIRAKAADGRNKIHLLKGLSPEMLISHKPSSRIYSLMPPRRKWLQLNQEKRYKAIVRDDDSLYRQSLNTYMKNLKSLKMTIRSHSRHENGGSYMTNLRHFVTEIKQAVLDLNYVIHPPVTYPESKNKSLYDNKIECRPISTYLNLKDRVIINLANKYLTILFDKYFYDESLAFRAERKYHSENKVFTNHHHAIERILEFRSKFYNKNIYVAECDIQKFYDTVNHSVVKNGFRKLMKKAQREYPAISFSCIERIFYSYLKSFTYPINVYSLNSDAQFWKLHKISNGKFEWVGKQLIEREICKSERSFKRLKVGVPQGGALSGLIANIVLNSVDQWLLPHISNNVLYLRYCDDMILFSTNKKLCAKILKLYHKSLNDLKLIPHQIDNKLLFGCKEFWKRKSKPVYKWDKAIGSDWLGFVGYEINRAGDIRIRKTSLSKEKSKQARVIKELFSEINNKKCLAKGTIERSFINRLIAMSVGRVTLWNHSDIESELCWANGFKKLNVNKDVITQMKNLDRYRNQSIYKAKKILRELNISETSNNQENNPKDSYVKYYGKPFSYFGQLTKNLKK